MMYLLVRDEENQRRIHTLHGSTEEECRSEIRRMFGTDGNENDPDFQIEYGYRLRSAKILVVQSEITLDLKEYR